MRKLNDLGDWLAIHTTRFQGTWTFLIVHFVWWAIWMRFIEAHPFELLTLCVSLEAIVQTSLVAMGQRLIAERMDEADAAAEAPKNVAAVATCRHCREKQ